MYYRSGGLIIIVSLVMAVIGFWRLWMAGRQKAFFKFLAGVVAYPVVFSLVSKIPDDHLRLWVAIPVACLLPLWLLIGIFIYTASENAKSKHMKENTIRPESNDTFITKRRILGLILSLVGVVVWVYGATHPEMTKNIEIILLGGFMYAMLIGLCWLITGKRIGEI